MGCSQSNNRLNGIEHFVETTQIDILEVNLRDFWRDAILNIGGWTTIGASDGGKFPKLLSLPDCEGSNCYSSMRKDWVWHDVTYSGLDGGVWHPMVPPEVYASGVLQPSGSYSINYEDGVVCFDSAPTEPVTASYSFNNVQVYIQDEVPWWRQLQQYSLDFDDNHFERCENGDWQIGPHNRIQLPALIIGAVGTGELIPYGLGELGCSKRRQDVVYHIITEDKCMRDKMVDWIILQDEQNLLLYNPNLVRFAADQPLDCNGAINSGLKFQELVDNYPGGCARATKSRLSGADSFRSGIWDAVVIVSYEVQTC